MVHFENTNINFDNAKLLSPEHQKIMLIMFVKKEIDFENQNIYNNKRSFERAMKYLIERRYVYKKDGKYKLTIEGRMLVNLIFRP